MSFNTEFGLPPRTSSPTLEEQENYSHTIETKSIYSQTEPANAAKLIFNFRIRQIWQKSIKAGFIPQQTDQLLWAQHDNVTYKTKLKCHP